MFDITNIVTAFLTLGAYTTAVCYFFYRLNERSIDKSDHLHKEQLEKAENRIMNTISEWRKEHKQQIEKMDEKWERLFERLLIQDKQKG